MARMGPTPGVRLIEVSIKRELTVIRFQFVLYKLRAIGWEVLKIIHCHCTGMSMEGDWGWKGEWEAGKERSCERKCPENIPVGVKFSACSFRFLLLSPLSREKVIKNNITVNEKGLFCLIAITIQCIFWFLCFYFCILYTCTCIKFWSIHKNTN